ncbi:MAG TPA: alpha-glucosidase C-terminal domain-containing protein, partial [Terriglobales bacterium]|nr:alpha-glucosidase C-terminal domain-containing protein [Terriglobales bacterium]
KAFVYGSYEDLDPQNPNVFAYTRTLGSEKYLVVLNFSPHIVEYRLPKGMTVNHVVMCNYPSKPEGTSVLRMRGWEARVYKQ